MHSIHIKLIEKQNTINFTNKLKANITEDIFIKIKLSLRIKNKPSAINTRLYNNYYL